MNTKQGNHIMIMLKLSEYLVKISQKNSFGLTRFKFCSVIENIFLYNYIRVETNFPFLQFIGNKKRFKYLNMYKLVIFKNSNEVYFNQKSLNNDN